MSTLPASFQISTEVSRALELEFPIVALESTVITHGLPFPENLHLAEDVEYEVRAQGATPATIAVIDGVVHIGLSSAQLQHLARNREKLLKISLRDFAPAIAKKQSGGTTVAATILAAHRVGIQVFATGGIGGVHHELNARRRGAFDISADLPALAHIPMIVVCAGAKAILDLQSTLEYLETWGIPVIGYKTDEFPAFYSISSGFKTSGRADDPDELVKIARAHWELGLQSAVLTVVPPPEEIAIPSDEIKQNVQKALKAAQKRKLIGQEVTPFLLTQMSELTEGRSLQANLGLLLNNARIASQIARSLAR